MAQNLQRHGTGTLNIDATRIPMSEDDRDRIENMGGFGTIEGATPNDVYGKLGPAESAAHDGGRYPANLMLAHGPGCTDDACQEGCPVAEMDRQSGETTSAGGRIGKKEHGALAIGGAGEYEAGDPGFGDTGGASRFFYVAKPTTAERDAGGTKNVHPTVKPIELMRQLVVLVTPPGGCVLDPFTGSGTTGIAAHLEGRKFVGIERDEEYRALALERIGWWERIPEGTPVDAALASERRERAVRDTGQGSLL